MKAVTWPQNAGEDCAAIQSLMRKRQGFDLATHTPSIGLRHPFSQWMDLHVGPRFRVPESQGLECACNPETLLSDEIYLTSSFASGVTS